MDKLSYIKHPNLILLYLDSKNILRINDKKYIELLYQKKLKRKINLDNPRTFNEKIQWLKLNDRNPEYTKMVDKYKVKEYVGNIIGNEYIIPTLGVWDKFEEIDFDRLPNQFVLKCTHDSGCIVICKNKEKLNIESAKKKLDRALKTNYYYAGREWPYKNVKPRIIAEQYMEEKGEDQIKDYKIFCFNGKAKIILVCSNRNGNFKNTDFYDCDWNLMPFTREKHINNQKGIAKPGNLVEMLSIAEKLSNNIPFVRVDLYEINGKVYFGELTFYPSSGCK